MKSGDYPWCVTQSEGNKIRFICQRCNQFHFFDNTEMTVDRFVEISEAFCVLHKDCKLKVKGGKEDRRKIMILDVVNLFYHHLSSLKLTL